MTDAVLVGRGDAISSIARSDWEQGLSSAPQMISQRLAFMSRDHHLVRNFVVRELPRLGRPIPLADISNALHLTPTRTSSIVGDLEKNLFFLVRGTGEEVSWAFPVTAEETGHQLVFSTGERLDAAWAEDAIATPFVQGQLRQSPLVVEIKTTCAHCGEPIGLVVDSELNYRIARGGPRPLVFEPDVNWSEFKDPTIIDGYWRKSVFFWSEEHARDYRSNVDQIDGTYLTIDQSCYSTRIVQGALFALWKSTGPTWPALHDLYVTWRLCPWCIGSGAGSVAPAASSRCPCMIRK